MVRSNLWLRKLLMNYTNIIAQLSTLRASIAAKLKCTSQACTYSTTLFSSCKCNTASGRSEQIYFNMIIKYSSHFFLRNKNPTGTSPCPSMILKPTFQENNTEIVKSKFEPLWMYQSLASDSNSTNLGSFQCWVAGYFWTSYSRGLDPTERYFQKNYRNPSLF